MVDSVDSTQYIRITNLNRTSGEPNNFLIDLSNETSLHQAKSVWIHTVTVPNVFNNIDAHNNVLEIQATNAGGAPSIGPIPVTVPAGFYTTTQLLSTLKTLIDTALIPVTGTVTFTQDPITNRVSYTTTGLDDLRIFSVTELGTSTLAPFIGNTGTTVASPTGTFNDMPTLSGESMIYLHSKDINMGKMSISTANTNTVNTNRNVSAFCSIPVKVPYLANIHYESRGSEVDHINLEGIKDLGTINIKLRSVDGRLLYLGENHELTIVLKVFY